MIEVFTDGASQGNPGPSGAGVYIKSDGTKHKYCFPLGELSNHEAEFHAVIKALNVCQNTFPDDILSFRSDSQLVVEAINKNHTKNSQFLPLLQEINQLGKTFPYFFIKWIPNKENKHADELAKKAIHLN